MAFTLDDLHFLASADGKALLDRLAVQDLSESRSLALLTALRKTHTPEQARAALSMARLRLKAVTKFGVQAQQLFFTEDSLQQASHPLVRAYRVSHFPAESAVLDVCCGIGADTLAFAEKVSTLHAVDIDPVRIAIAQHNAQVLGRDHVTFHVGDVRENLPDTYEWDVIFYDPARRDAQGKRIYDVERYIPPLSLMKQWSAKNIMVKLSPGVDLSQLAEYGGGVEFISVEGDLKEAVLHLGEFSQMTELTATLLTNAGGVHHWQREADPYVDVGEPRAWLVEPDAALIRAGLVQDAAQTFNGTLLDDTIAYFSTDDKPESVWVRAWRIREWMPFHLKKLRAYLRECDIGTVTVKKRGSPLTPETLIPKLKLKGDNTCTLVLTRLRGQPIVLICDDYQP